MENKLNEGNKAKLGSMIAQSQCYVFIARFWGNGRQIVYLQQVNRVFYKRVAQWVRLVYRNPKIRLTETEYPNPYSKGQFEFPATARINKMLANGDVNFLAGFENDQECGTGSCFNFILSNGCRSTQKDKKHNTKYTHMIPRGALKIIRSANILYSYDQVQGFEFFDKDG